MAQRGVQVECAVGLTAMQKHRDPDDGDVGHPKGREHQLPPGQFEQAGEKQCVH